MPRIANDYTRMVYRPTPTVIYRVMTQFQQKFDTLPSTPGSRSTFPPNGVIYLSRCNKHTGLRHQTSTLHTQSEL